ncbi:MAG: hypothetical protein KQH53_18770 [Desulfarculaceae bacterium]|nr:hypothetical protein [Desulfarculaceae bacterium]
MENLPNDMVDRYRSLAADFTRLSKNAFSLRNQDLMDANNVSLVESYFKNMGQLCSLTASSLEESFKNISTFERLSQEEKDRIKLIIAGRCFEGLEIVRGFSRERAMSDLPYLIQKNESLNKFTLKIGDSICDSIELLEKLYETYYDLFVKKTHPKSLPPEADIPTEMSELFTTLEYISKSFDTQLLSIFDNIRHYNKSLKNSIADQQENWNEHLKDKTYSEKRKRADRFTKYSKLLPFLVSQIFSFASDGAKYPGESFDLINEYLQYCHDTILLGKVENMLDKEKDKMIIKIIQLPLSMIPLGAIYEGYFNALTLTMIHNIESISGDSMTKTTTNSK